MTEIDIDFSSGPIRAIGVPASFSDTLILDAPCEFCGWSMRDVSGTTSQSAEGSVVSPALGATIATLAGLGQGQYVVSWEVQLIGAAAAADQDNFKLISSAGLSVVSLNAGAAGQYPQTQVEAAIPLNGSFTIQAIGAGTVGVTYAAQLTIQTAGIVNSEGEFQDGNNALAETSVIAGGSDTQPLFSGGIHVRNRLNFHPVAGLMTGCVYVRFAKHTG